MRRNGIKEWRSPAGQHPHRRYRRTKKISNGAFAAQVASASIFAGVMAWTLAPQVQAVWAMSNMTPEQVEAVESSVYFSGCREARAAGAAPIYRGSPGYRDEMDGDSDGVACEPYRGSGFD